MTTIRWDGNDIPDSLTNRGFSNDGGVIEKGYRLNPQHTNGLIGWYPLNSNGSSIPDLTGNSGDGSNNGTIPCIKAKGGSTGRHFNGSSDYISTPANLTTPGTITAWVKADSASSNGNVTSNRSNSQEGWGLAITGSSGEYRISIGTGSNWNSVDFGAVTLGEWQFVAVTYDGSVGTGYINGVEGNTVSSSLSPSPDSLSIGREGHGGWGSYFDGTLADVRVYDRVLPQSELERMYNWGIVETEVPVPTDGVTYLPLDGDTTDQWGSNDGNPINSPTSDSEAIDGSSYRFNGSDQYIEVGTTDILGGLTNASVGAWFKADQLKGNGERVIANDDISVWQINFQNGNSIHARWHSGSSWYATGTTPIVAGEWYHVFTTFDNGEFKLYLNGQEVGSGNTGSSTTVDNNQAPRIASGNSGGGAIQNPLDGLVDDVRFYDRTLSQAEIYELYRWGTVGRDMRELTVDT